MTIWDWITTAGLTGTVIFTGLALFTAITGKSTVPRWLQRRAGWITDAEARDGQSSAQRRADRGSKR